MPDWFGTEGNPVNTHHFPDSPKDRYRQFYYQAFDYTIQSIKSRFSQTDYKKYSLLQQLLLKAANGDDWAEEFQSVCSFYTTDFKKSLLSSQLEILPASLRVENAISITELIAKFKSLDPARKVLLSEVLKVFKILLVMPATNAVSERSFSALKRVIIIGQGKNFEIHQPRPRLKIILTFVKWYHSAVITCLLYTSPSPRDS